MPHGSKMAVKESSITSSFRIWKGGRIVLDVYVQESKKFPHTSSTICPLHFIGQDWVIWPPLLARKAGELENIVEDKGGYYKTKLVCIDLVSSQKCLLYWFLACSMLCRLWRKAPQTRRRLNSWRRHIWWGIRQFWNNFPLVWVGRFYIWLVDF